MITKQQVQHVAKLSRLGLTAREITKIQKELSSILDYIKLLEEVDIAGIALTSHSIPVKNAMREDEVKAEEPETVNKILEQAPVREKGYVRVKGILQ